MTNRKKVYLQELLKTYEERLIADKESMKYEKEWFDKFAESGNEKYMHITSDAYNYYMKQAERNEEKINEIKSLIEKQ